MLCNFAPFAQGSYWSVLVGLIRSFSTDHRQVSWPHPPAGVDSCGASPPGQLAPGEAQLSNTGTSMDMSGMGDILLSDRSLVNRSAQSLNESLILYPPNYQSFGNFFSLGRGGLEV